MMHSSLGRDRMLFDLIKTVGSSDLITESDPNQMEPFRICMLEEVLCVRSKSLTAGFLIVGIK